MEPQGDGPRAGVCQKDRDPETLRLAARQPFPVDVVFARHPAADGYPVWDVCEEARRVWGLLRGEYVTFAHAEFLWCAESEAAVTAVRLGRGGTVARFARRMADWLSDGGLAEAAAYHRRQRG